MLFIEYPKCTTCQKAKKWLDENGIVYENLREDQKREVVSLLIDKIKLTNDINNFEIIWNI